MKKLKTLGIICCLAVVFMLSGCSGETPAGATGGCAHEYGAWENVQTATCSVAGLQRRVCAKCNLAEENQLSNL